MPSARRFPPPWTIEEHAESFIVRDATGQALVSTLTTSRSAAPHQSADRDEARRMAANFAKLPELVRKR